ncbi:family 43 glycosylhydrolase [Maribacter sp. MAR_2009_72]|uniref:glycoside hydrolase family 43 protein n=1 Tax=Maribacter sp. MAR_2009_72 TaxID=1250050 RepID=UPI0011997156|nr:family 43 glycosylhydrolase [Maribacter sp. MAR_2009_72]TVZ15506.1 GH43 family beta-xylosidase [Maribacter sp. MAR_2009_72]
MKTIKILTTFLILITFFSKSFSQTTAYNNPIAEQRADPWVWKDTDSTYYLIATVPEYDRIVIRKAKTINGLGTAQETEVWHKYDKGEMSTHIWAPELHKIGEKWYIYFAAAPIDDKWKIRIWILSNSSQDPMQGEWKKEGQLKTENDSFSLDATTFEFKGKRYLAWAQRVGDGTGILLSEMKDPTTLTGPEIVLSIPEYEWERKKYNVNEGPAVLIKNGKIFISYSASATNHNYCMGLLWIDEKEDLMDISNWHKSPAPVFSTNDDFNRFGPGHNSFTSSEDGKDVVMIYHARNYKEIIGHELDDPNRATRARIVYWTKSGFPDFMQSKED